MVKVQLQQFLKEILEAHDLSVNIYTSPHLINFNERIRINKKLISDKNLINILEEVELKIIVIQ